MPRSLPIEPSASFGERIRYARKRAGLSQVDLAVKAGVHKDTISGWERGRFGAEDVHEANVRAVAQATGAPVKWLIDGGPAPDYEPRTVEAAGSGEPAESMELRIVREAYGGKSLSIALGVMRNQLAQAAALAAFIEERIRLIEAGAREPARSLAEERDLIIQESLWRAAAKHGLPWPPLTDEAAAVVERQAVEDLVGKKVRAERAAGPRTPDETGQSPATPTPPAEESA